MNSDPILTVSEVADELRCSKAHVFNMLAGKIPGVTILPCIQMGRRKVVRRSSLEAWKGRNDSGSTGDILPVSPNIEAV